MIGKFYWVDEENINSTSQKGMVEKKKIVYLDSRETIKVEWKESEGKIKG